MFWYSVCHRGKRVSVKKIKLAISKDQIFSHYCQYSLARTIYKHFVPLQGNSSMSALGVLNSFKLLNISIYLICSLFLSGMPPSTFKWIQFIKFDCDLVLLCSGVLAITKLKAFQAGYLNDKRWHLFLSYLACSCWPLHKDILSSDSSGTSLL